ncbi:hypothetical protein GP486_006067 [Trichoglossum hirsutum]|uniref:Uncharacterized protein n=1 Tax=Trichoglossum hirsutum TaxID=265104 RepID=A0A9P8L818_9PEZI|nr:hypothetical protein GP486_006067 [Trichoglossum hirsutum]
MSNLPSDHPENSVRTPGQYRQVEPLTGAQSSTTPALSNTNEHIHASVRIRLGLGGPGINDDKVGLLGDIKRGIGLGPNKGYKAEALEAGDGRHAWRCVANTQNPPSDPLGASGQIYWEAAPPGVRLPEGFPKTLPEDALGRWEVELLRKWPDIWTQFWTIIPQP